MAYFANIKRGIKTTTKGLSLTLKHFWAARNTKGPLNVQDKDYFNISEGYVTLQYPHETISVPEIGRYQLDCEIDDCIVCDKCAKICPVDCIEIEAIKSPELIRTTSDGSPVRLHAAKFDIDLAKCCFCGLCTTVCPTECLTMNSEYDYSVTDVNLLNFAFSNLTLEEANEKRRLFDQFVAEKEAAKIQIKPAEAETGGDFKPKFPGSGGFVPKSKPLIDKPSVVDEKPKFTPKFKSIPSENVEEDKPKFIPNRILAENKTDAIENQPKAFIPKIKSLPAESTSESKKAFIPKAKPQIVEENLEAKDSIPKPNLPFKPKNKPTTATNEIEINTLDLKTKPSLPFKPKLKPEKSSEEKNIESIDSKDDLIKKTSLPFKPKLKPVVAEIPLVDEGEKPDLSENEVENHSVKKFTPKLRPKA